MTTPTNQPNETPYDAIILDAGGDDLITLKGPLASPAEVARAMDNLHRQRTRRLVMDATPEQQGMFERWKTGREPLYARRFVNLPDGSPLVIYLSAPALRDALTAEINLGATAGEIQAFTTASLSGLIYGTFYSTVEPYGEPGSCHVCDLEEIPWEAFDAARQKEWSV